METTQGPREPERERYVSEGSQEGESPRVREPLGRPHQRRGRGLGARRRRAHPAPR
jgi:hypothetical protein